MNAASRPDILNSDDDEDDEVSSLSPLPEFLREMLSAD